MARSSRPGRRPDRPCGPATPTRETIILRCRAVRDSPGRRAALPVTFLARADVPAPDGLGNAAPGRGTVWGEPRLVHEARGRAPDYPPGSGKVWDAHPPPDGQWIVSC